MMGERVLTASEMFFSVFPDLSLTGIICVLLAGWNIGADFSSRTVNLTVASGYSRLQYWFSKTVVYSLAALFITFLYPLCAAFVGLLVGGVGEIPFEQDGLYLLRVLLLFAAAVIASNGFVILITSVFSHSGAAIGIFLGMKVVTQILLLYLNFKAEKLAEILVNIMPTSNIQMITSTDLTTGEIALNAGINAVVAVVMFVLSYLIIRRKELK
jgi:ABC-type transport system involved in multi-copper enzyme maturation permease subunit